MFSLFQAVSWGHVCSPTCHRGAQSAVSGFPPPPGGNSHSESETWGNRGKGGALILILFSTDFLDAVLLCNPLASRKSCWTL